MLERRLAALSKLIFQLLQRLYMRSSVNAMPVRALELHPACSGAVAVAQ